MKGYDSYMKTKQTRWYSDIQKIIRGITIFICFIAALTLKKGELFIQFESRQPAVNDFLHDYIFRNLLDKVNLFTVKATFFLIVVTIIISILAYIFEHYDSEMGYKLHIAGMTMTALSGIFYILIHVGIGYGKPVITIRLLLFIVFLLMCIIITIHNLIFYTKRQSEFKEEGLASKIAIFLIIGCCFIGYGVYLAKNLASDYKTCWATNQYLKNQPTEINEEISYQMGNAVKLNSIYCNGYIYYANKKKLYQIDAAGNVEILYTLPNDATFYATNIFHHDGHLYIACSNFNNTYSKSIIQFSLADKTVKEIYSRDGNNMFFSVIDGKLLYEVENEYRSDIYCIDLDKSLDVADATLYDKDIYSLSIDREIWIQKYMYSYLDYTYWFCDDIQFIDDKGYYIYDLVADEQGYDYKAPDKYSYNANCTLIMIDKNPGTDYIAEGVVDFNIFNKTIYYASESETGYDILSCDENGNNASYISSIPVDFIYEKHGGYYADIIMGDGFMLCTVSATHDDTHRYFIDIESGEVKEIELN